MRRRRYSVPRDTLDAWLREHVRAGLNYVRFAHDNDCPTIDSFDLGDCTCATIDVYVVYVDSPTALLDEMQRPS